MGHFAVVVRGRSVLEIEKGRMVTLLAPGALLLEGLAAEYGAYVRADTVCEGYRIRKNDFMMAVNAVPSSRDWIYRFRLLEKETRRHFQARLSAVRGVTDGLAPHPNDMHIDRWKAHRTRAMDRAQRLKTADGLKKLPNMTAHPLHAWRRRPDSQAMNRVSSAPSLGTSSCSLPRPSMTTYSAHKLPRLQTMM